MWKVIFSTKDGMILRTLTFDNVWTAEDCFYQHVNFNSVRSGYNTVRLEKVNKEN